MYLNIEDIEAEGQKVPIHVEVSLPNLNSDGKGNPIDEGSTVALPMWLASPLASATSGESDPFAMLEQPDAFSTDVLNALRTDPASVNLYEQSPVFTTLALEWLKLFDLRELADVLAFTIQTRISVIYDNAMALKGPASSFDEYERRIYDLTHGLRRDRKKHQQTVGN